MKATTTALSVVLVFFSTCLIAMGGDPSEQPYRLVGSSKAVFTGKTGGVFLMGAACKQDFGPRARMCFLSEALRTVNPPADLAPQSWLNLAHDGAGSRYAQAKINGHEIGCKGWTSVGGAMRGQVITPEGRYRLAKCSNDYPVACCTPGGTQPANPPAPEG